MVKAGQVMVFFSWADRLRETRPVRRSKTDFFHKWAINVHEWRLVISCKILLLNPQWLRVSRARSYIWGWKSSCTGNTTLVLSTRLSAQEGPLADKPGVLELNRSIDQNVVRQRMAELKDQYADDFVFTHGTGLVDGKNSWLQVWPGRLPGKNS